MVNCKKQSLTKKRSRIGIDCVEQNEKQEGLTITVNSERLNKHCKQLKTQKMKANYTHVSMLLDRSGSMEEIKSYIIEGFNDFIKNQKKEPGELSVTLVQFDTEYEVLQDHKSVNDIPLLTSKI